MIGPSNTNTRSLQVATYYSHHSHSSHGSQFSWQVGTVHAGGGTTFSSSLSATVASALSANLPGIRTRRHLSNIHYDQQHTSRQVHVKDGEMKRPVGKQAVAQNPGATIRKARFNYHSLHPESPLSADNSISDTKYYPNRSLTRYVETYGNQTRHYSSPVTISPQFTSNAQQKRSVYDSPTDTKVGI